MLFTLDFIGIGAGKAATTTVARLLDAHPDICLSVPKEVRYFNRYNNYHFQCRNNSQFGKPLDWYSNHFTHCQSGSKLGEFSPQYLVDPEAPTAIYERFPDTKLILCMRNPADRAYSSYQMIRHYHRAEKRPFSEAIRAEPEYVEKGLYYKHLCRYLKYFDLSQFAFVLFDDMKKKPAQCIRQLYEFLGVNPNFTPEHIGLAANPFKRTRFRWLKQLEFHAVNTIAGKGGTAFIEWLKDKGLNTMMHRIYTQPTQYPPMSTTDRDWLREQFARDLVSLERLLNQDFSDWK